MMTATMESSSASALSGENATAILIGDGEGGIRWRPGQRFHHLFEDVVDGLGAAAKNTIAVEFADESYSYADLEALANRLASYFSDEGVKPGDRVAVQFDRTIHAYASLLAISKLGGVFIPLDVGFPASRIEYILKDSAVSLVATLSFYTNQFTGLDLPVLALDAEQAEIESRSQRRLSEKRKDVEGDALAYVIYTSGTTGRPKGVQIAHSSIVNFLQVARDCYGYQSDDRVYQSLTLAFDYAFEEIWVPLLSGARLVPAPVGVNLLGADLADFLASREVTAYCCVPTVLSTIETDLPKLRLLITSGEACPRDLAERWLEEGRRVLNLYGPTETTVSATWGEIEPGKPITIGGPLPTYTTMILDTDEPRLLSRGETGELAIAGIGVSSGYLNRPEETNRAFIEDFIGIENNPGGMIYRSGDLARITDQGEIEYIGRKDTQVKIRGYRIELGEIEAVARDVSGLTGIVVNPVEIEEGQKELVVYYVPSADGTAPEPTEMHDGLKDRLPPFMVPSYYEKLPAMPLMASGKVDRNKLPAPSDARLTETGKSFVEPAEGVESDLAALLATILKVEKVSADADFFDDLGANSLVMARYLGKVRKTLGLKGASMRQIYEHPSIASLAAAIAPPDEPETAKESEAIATETPEIAAGVAIGDLNKAPEMPAAKLAFVAEPKNEIAPAVPPSEEPIYIAPRLQYVLCGVYQVTYMLFSAFLLALCVDLGFRFINAGSGLLDVYLRAVGVGVASFVSLSAVLLLVKWVAIGRFREEKIPLWSGRYVRFWIAQAAIRSNPLNAFIGTPLYSVYLRLLGAKVGKGALLFSPVPVCTDLVSIGDNALIRQDCRMPGYTAHRGYLHTGSISIGDRTFISEATTLDINSAIGADAQLGTSSALMQGQRIEGGRNYQGCPAQETATNFIRVPNLELPTLRAQVYTGVTILNNMLISWPLPIALAYLLLTLGFGAGFQSTAVGVVQVSIASLIGYAALLYVSGILLALLGVLTMPKIYSYFFKPETVHPLFGIQYFLATRLTASSNSVLLQSLCGDSSLIMPYYRGVGYDLSEATQNGSNFGVEQRQHSPFLCKFNRNTLVSDGLALLNLDISRSSFKFSKVEVPADAYLGNDLHYPAGAKVGQNCLIATKAYVPIDGPVRDDVGLLGSPSFQIPRTVARDGRFDHYKTPAIFEQRLKMKLKSNLITLGLFMFRSWTTVFLLLAANVALFGAFAAEVVASSLASATLITVMLAGTLVLLPMYYVIYEWLANAYTPMKPRLCSLYEKPFWDHERFWKLNINPYFAVFDGTPLKSVFVRMQGVKLGRQVFDNGAGISEPYMVEIGDYACLNFGSNIQGHSLENATFKSDVIKIGDRCTLGVQAFVHYGAVIGDDATIETDAFVMKGSMIGDGETWRGNPAQNVVETPAETAEPQKSVEREDRTHAA